MQDSNINSNVKNWLKTYQGSVTTQRQTFTYPLATWLVGTFPALSVFPGFGPRLGQKLPGSALWRTSLRKSRIRETLNLSVCVVSSTDTLTIQNLLASMQILLCIYANFAMRPCKFRGASMQFPLCIPQKVAFFLRGDFSPFLTIKLPNLRQFSFLGFVQGIFL